MAKKKPTTKTKKLHPGGSVDDRTPVTGTAPVTKQQRRTVLATDPAFKQQRNFAGQMKPVMGRAEIAPAPSPTQRAVAVQQPGELIPAPQRAKRVPIDRMGEGPVKNITPEMMRRMRKDQRRAKARNRWKNRMRRVRGQNPLMPTAGVSQGRPVTSRTPMPGPAPDAARMRRMQQLMRQQQARFNLNRAAKFPSSNSPRTGRQTEAAREAASAIFQKQQKAASERRKGLGDRIKASRYGRPTGFK